MNNPHSFYADYGDNMCLAIPMKLISRDGDSGVVENDSITYSANLQLLSEVKVGDYLLVHAGFAINKLDEEDAKKTLKLYREVVRLSRPSPLVKKRALSKKHETTGRHG